MYFLSRTHLRILIGLASLASWLDLIVAGAGSQTFAYFMAIMISGTFLWTMAKGLHDRMLMWATLASLAWPLAQTRPALIVGLFSLGCILAAELYRSNLPYLTRAEIADWLQISALGLFSLASALALDSLVHPFGALLIGAIVIGYGLWKLSRRELKVSASIVVVGTPDKVWDLVSDSRRWKLWQTEKNLSEVTFDRAHLCMKGRTGGWQEKYDLTENGSTVIVSWEAELHLSVTKALAGEPHRTEAKNYQGLGQEDLERLMDILIVSPKAQKVKAKKIIKSKGL